MPKACSPARAVRIAMVQNQDRSDEIKSKDLTECHKTHSNAQYLSSITDSNNQEYPIIHKLTDVQVDVEHPIELHRLRRGVVALESDGGGVGETRVEQGNLCNRNIFLFTLAT